MASILGTSFKCHIPTKEISSKDHPGAPGLNWTLDPETIQQIKAIEENSRTALVRIQNFYRRSL